MSSFPSRASTSSPGWQNQSNLGKGRTHPAAQRNPQSPLAGSTLKSNHIVSTNQVQDFDPEAYSPADQTRYHHDTQPADTHSETLQPHSDPSSHYLSSYSSYLTPDHGSENLFSEQSSHNSPSIDDFINWQELSTSQDQTDYGHGSFLVNNAYTEYNQDGDLQGIVPKEISPTLTEQRSETPRMSATTTTTTTASATLNSLQGSTGPNQYVPVRMGSERVKRSHTPDDVEEQQNNRLTRSTSVQHQNYNTHPSGSQVVNPLVLVSTYQRGDSPARSNPPMMRSLSKRSQSSRLSEHEEAAALSDGRRETVEGSSRLQPPGHQWEEDDDGDDDDDGERTNRGGVAPSHRNTETIPSANEMEKQRELDETRADVEHWLSTSQPPSPISTNGERKSSYRRGPGDRVRSRSTGARRESLAVPRVSDRHIPGPGVLIDVDSDYYYSDADSSHVSAEESGDQIPESPPATVETVDPATEQSYFPPVQEESIAPEENNPLPRQFYRRTPWQDPFRHNEAVDESGQPPTANHAIMQYESQAAKFETASRAATWGTRRLSDSDITSIIDGSKVRHMSLTKKNRTHGNSFVDRAIGLVRRTSSTVKRNRDPSSRQERNSRQHSPSEEIEEETLQKVSSGGQVMSPPQMPARRPSASKPRSPPLHSTSSAFIAISGHLAAVGSSTSTPSIEPERPKSPNFLSGLKRSRSKSELPRTPKSTPGLSELWNRQGGPPVPTLASPMQTRVSLDVPHDSTESINRVNEEMEDDGEEEVGVQMPLPVQDHNIIPNLDGFRTHARQLNPRLEQYLIERIAHDQLRRYKKLVKNKIEHTRNVQHKHSCASGKFCADLGGKPKILPPRASTKDANVNYAQFKVGNGGDSDADESAFTEGVVTPALFPSGIPLPPTTHLPAEFECPLCFQVKKFQKPSDWTKHVHEDVQPFSCTFPNCPEPKSFKRKADWVRHENERHRHLEWWRCSIHECVHICYRKDNFVQHLVREHKMTEPKSRGQRPVGKARNMGRGTQHAGSDADDFWLLVENCRHETTTNPRQEPCKFCGNVCSTWKKLSVHVGKHMEQIAMPVLDLAAKRAVTADTVISPIDQPHPRTIQTSMLDATSVNGATNFDALSPYTASAVSNYQSSSAGHSPVPMQSAPNQQHSSNQTFYEQNLMQNGMQNGMQQMAGPVQQFSNGNAITTSYPYESYEVVAPNYIGMPPQSNNFSQQSHTQSIPAPFHTQQVPRSQAMDAGSNYGNLSVDTSMYSQSQYYSNNSHNGTPGGNYMTGYNVHDMGNHPDSALTHSPHPTQTQPGHAQMHMPTATNAQVNSNGFMFTPHQNGSNGESYY